MAFAAGAVAPRVAVSQSPAQFLVDTVSDVPDAVPGDGVCGTLNGACSLRAAIQEANALPGPDTILLQAARYAITVPPSGDGGSSVGDLDISDSLTIEGVSADATVIDGGGTARVFEIRAATAITVTLTALTIENGTTTEDGGGLAIDTAGAVELIDSVVRTGDAAAGGGIHLAAGTLTNTRSTVGENDATTDGGGIYLTGGALIVRESAISGNNATRDGGGIAMVGGTLTLTDSRLSDNIADNNGGGIHNAGTAAAATVTDSTIDGNLASPSGSGIFWSGSSATLQIAGSTLSGNFAEVSGGGLLVDDGAVTVTNSTLSTNTAGFNGGAMQHNAGGLTRTSATVHGNSAVDGRVVFRSPNASPILQHTILSGVAGSRNCNESLSSQGSNLDSDGTCGLDDPTDRSNLDPLLGPLEDNGGSTLTHALLSGSPAINAASQAACPTTDQRGFDRSLGDICDIGAYEQVRAIVALSAGWNLVGWTGEERPVANATQSIDGQFSALFAWDAAAARFLRFDPAAPPFLNNLTHLTAGSGVCLLVTNAAGASWNRPFVVDARSVPLLPGFNLVTWTGPDGTAVEEAVAGLGDALLTLFIWDAAAERFLRFDPSAPPYPQRREDSSTTRRRSSTGKASGCRSTRTSPGSSRGRRTPEAPGRRAGTALRTPRTAAPRSAPRPGAAPPGTGEASGAAAPGSTAAAGVVP